MKIDHDYLKKLLEAFEAAPAPIVNILELQAAGLDYDNDQFVFHMDILDDQGFVERDDREPGFGLTRGLDGHMSWSVSVVRVFDARSIGTLERADTTRHAGRQPEKHNPGNAAKQHRHLFRSTRPDG